jgi:alkylation response protein AidB-like acyl-CoA dehydrogenase
VATSKIQDLLARNDTLAREVLAPHADELDRARRFPRENLKALGQGGVLGLLVPAQYGGAGAGIQEMAAVIEKMAQACASTAMVTLMHYCGTAVLAAKGNDKLKEDLLPAVARGQHITTLAFSEAGSGGHFYSPVSQVSRDGHRLTLSALKSFVTSAGEADSYIVSTRKANATSPIDLDLYLLPRATKGFEVEGRFEGLGLAGNASAPMKLVEVQVDPASRLGEEGTGFQSLMEVILPHFQVGAAAISLGIAASAFRAATAHVSARKYEHAGGAALSAIPRVQFLTAEMALELRSARTYLQETICRVAAADPEAMLDVLGVKVRAADASLAIVSRAMTLGGGSAFGRRGGLERIFRDAQACAVMAPATDVLKEFLGKACLGLPLF